MAPASVAVASRVDWHVAGAQATVAVHLISFVTISVIYQTNVPSIVLTATPPPLVVPNKL